MEKAMYEIYIDINKGNYYKIESYKLNIIIKLIQIVSIHLVFHL